MNQVIFFTIMLFCLNLSTQADFDTYEDEMVFHLVETYAEGEIVWLGAAGSPFLGLYREAHDDPSGRAAIILHSMGGHADWPEVIAPLRTGLPGEGWATLSIQLPVQSPQQPIARYGGTLESARSRIRSATRFLKDQSYSDIVLIGYSFGATTAINYLVNEDADIRAFAGISMQRHAFLSPAYNLTAELEKLSVPILDIYGSRDFSDVIGGADARRVAGNKSKAPVYHQVVMNDTDHYFSGQQAKLLTQLLEWLDSIVPGEIPVEEERLYFL